MPDTPCPSCGAPFGLPDLCAQCRGAVRFFGRIFPARSTTLRCTPCEAPLHELRLGTVRVDACLGCHGLWLDRGELQELLARPPSKLQAAPLRPEADGTRGVRHCPRCEAELARVRSGGVTLLRCAPHGVWLPATTLLALLRAGAAAATIAPAALLAPTVAAATHDPSATQSTGAADVGAAIVDGANLLDGVGVVVDVVSAILSAIDLPG